MTQQAEPTRPDPHSARRREWQETLHALRRVVLLFAIIILSPLTAFAYRFSHGTHPPVMAMAFRNAVLLVPAAFALICLALWVGEKVAGTRARRQGASSGSDRAH